jgi:hypothetical protein
VHFLVARKTPGFGVSPVSPRSACRFPRSAGTVLCARRAARQRGALCSFRSYPALVLLCTFLGHGYGQHPRFYLVAIPPHLLLLLYFSLRSGAVVILTSAARSGGEVGITEAERSGPILPGRRGSRPQPRPAAPAANGRRSMRVICEACVRCLRRWGAHGASSTKISAGRHQARQV